MSVSGKKIFFIYMNKPRYLRGHNKQFIESAAKRPVDIPKNSQRSIDGERKRAGACACAQPVAQATQGFNSYHGSFPRLFMQQRL
jgi:hypothetical protein